MLKLIKYLKKSAVPLALVFAVLFIQAVCDLALPAYTSDIVNTGIQQSGITEKTPVQIRAAELEKLLLFTAEEERDTVLAAYVLSEELYVKKQLDTEEEAELEAIMTLPMFLLSAMENGGEELADTGAVQLQDLSDLPESIVEQGAAAFMKAEYEAVGMDMAKLQNDYLFSRGARMLLIALVSMAASIFVGFMAARIAAVTSRDLRSQVFRKVSSFSNAEFDKFSTASLITRSTNDVQQVQFLIVMVIRMVLYAPIIGAGGILKIVNTNTDMAWIIGLAVVLIFIIVGVLFVVASPKFKSMQKFVDNVNLVLRENLTGLPVIRAFGRERHEEQRFDGANRDLMKVNLFVNRLMTCMMPLMTLLMNGITVLIVWNGAHGVDQGSMQVGDMMAFLQYAMQIISAFLMISLVSIMLPRAAVSAVRIDEILTSNTSIKDPEQAADFESAKKGLVEFHHVSFRYPGAEEDVIHDISFTAEPGKTTAVIGSTGSGKTTLVNLIPRFYDVTGGSIRVDGRDVREVSQQDLRDKLGYVPQKGMLFTGTIASNIAFGRPGAADEEIRQAAEIAQAAAFISEKEEQYESHIAQAGANVSGGQRQRLSIARAVVRRPEVYIFDDSFSALDYRTDKILRKALKAETGDSTVLIVAQRISTILHAEQIIVLDEGEIVGKGTHRELLRSCEVYRQIAMSQLSEKELDAHMTGEGEQGHE